MSVIPCKKNTELQKKIEEYSEILKTQAHTLGNHGLSEKEFYSDGLFRGAIERIRGQFSATMREKREFVQHVLNYLQDRDYINEWESAGEANRHDYSVILPNGKTSIIELKGCLDGNNTTIFERPPHANEFVIWSVCTNTGADPRHNTWSGIHTRLSAEIISRQQKVDGIVFWDMVCGTLGRPCPKIDNEKNRVINVGPYTLPPPCIYLMPSTIPSPRNNPTPKAQKIEDVDILKAFFDCFGVDKKELFTVSFDVNYSGSDIVRKTIIKQNGMIQKESKPTAIRRS